MITPLQVTILYLIVDNGGSAPTARWSLFSEYFEILKRREKSKGGEIQRVIEANWTHLGPIHQAVGLILQVKSEVEGGAGSRMDNESFKKILHSHFSEIGFSEQDISVRVEELMDLALNRLVLLAAKEEGFIRFDVRSLQEFMAAAALTSGELGVVEARLQHIAGIAHWRHVWLIAASRCFADDGFHHRRSAIIALPRMLEVQPQDQLINNGARLALELFNDGIGTDHPTSRNVLAKHAIELLNFGTGAVEEGISFLWEAGTEDIISDAIESFLPAHKTARWRAAWNLLMGLEKHPRLVEISKNHWPKETDLSFSLVSSIKNPPKNTFLRQLIRQALQDTDINDIYENIPQISHTADNNRWKDLEIPISPKSDHESEVQILTGISDQCLSIMYDSVSNTTNYANSFASSQGIEKWSSLNIISEFGANPTHTSLAVALSKLHLLDDWEVSKRLINLAPWPLAAILEASKSRDDLQQFSVHADAGEFGVLEDWIDAERRWSKDGLTDQDLLFTPISGPFDRKIGSIGCPPFTRMRVTMDEENAVKIVGQLARHAQECGSAQKGRDLAIAASFGTVGMTSSELPTHLSKAEIMKIASATMENSRPAYLSFFNAIGSQIHNDHDIAITISKLAESGIIITSRPLHDSLKIICEKLSANKDLYGMYVIIAGMLISVQDESNRSFVDSLNIPSADMVDREPDSVLVSYHMAKALLKRPEISADALGKIIVEFMKQSDVHTGIMVRRFFSSHLLDEDYKRDCLYSVLKLQWDNVETERFSLKAFMKASLDKRRSGLTGRQLWVGPLQLPVQFYDAVMA